MGGEEERGEERGEKKREEKRGRGKGRERTPIVNEDLLFAHSLHRVAQTVHVGIQLPHLLHLTRVPLQHHSALGNLIESNDDP